MRFEPHSDLRDTHALMSASKPHWLRYDDEKVADMVVKFMTAARGTRLHNLAKQLIDEGIRLPDTTQTLNMYVNDCISYRMQTEKVVFYTPNAYGTADAIEFRDRVLYIFDLKNGITKASSEQLEIYAAYFCLEYDVKPHKIEFDLRIYQHDQVYPIETNHERIREIMDRVIYVNAIIEDAKEV